MKNKIGINKIDLEDIENKLFSFKSSLLNEKFTFNCNEFNLKYLCGLHSFMFGDLYDDAGKISNRYNENEYKMINTKIKEVVDMIFYELDFNIIIEKIKDIIDMQLFDFENDRIVKLFFEHIIKMYKSNNNEYLDELLNSLKNEVKSL